MLKRAVGGFQYLVEGINDLGKTIHLYKGHSSPQINYSVIGEQGYAGLFFIKQQSHEGPVHQNDCSRWLVRGPRGFLEKEDVCTLMNHCEKMQSNNTETS